MNNSIKEISVEEVPQLEKRDTFLVELEGRDIKEKQDLFTFMEKYFKLPKVTGWDSLEDWMTDLSWIPNKKIELIIYHYDEFLKADLTSKDIFHEILEEDVLPYWSEDVTKITVGGTIKEFTVYLVI